MKMIRDDIGYKHEIVNEFKNGWVYLAFLDDNRIYEHKPCLLAEWRWGDCLGVILKTDINIKSNTMMFLRRDYSKN